MNPTPRDVHIDAALTDFSIAYIQDATNFVADRVFPCVPVQHMTDKYWIFDKNDYRRDDAVKKRAQGQAAPRSGFRLSTDSYSADSWWTEIPISDLLTRNADPAIMLDQVATQIVTQRMLIRRERLFAAEFFTTGIWGTDVVGGTDFTVWSDYASDPQKNIDTAKELILAETGRMPNKLTVGYKVHNALKRHPSIKDLYKYTSADSITEAMIANALELDEYIVAKASYSSNTEGAAAVEGFITGNNALLTVSDNAQSIMQPSAGAIFDWSELNGVSNFGVGIDQYYDQQTKDDIIRGEFAFDMKVTGSDLGYFFSGAIA